MAGEGAADPKDLECPHGVQFYDVVIDGERHPRNAWIYERPQPAMQAVDGSRRVLGERQGRLTHRAIFAKSDSARSLSPVTSGR